MSLSFNSVTGSAGFNAYASVSEVTDYASSKLNTTWSALSTATKEAVIIWATRQLDTLSWQGSMTDLSQEHEWPRTGVWKDGGSYSYEDQILYTARQFDQTTIPTFLKNATAELALQLVDEDTTASSGTEGFKRIKVDTIELEMLPTDRLSWFQDSVRNLCWRYMRNQSKYNVGVVRVG